MIIRSTIILVIFFVALYLILSRSFPHLFRDTSWNFAGYMAKDAPLFIEEKGLENQDTCIKYGNAWMARRVGDDVLFTCSQGCKQDGFLSQNTCQVCEYTRFGFQGCHK